MQRYKAQKSLFYYLEIKCIGDFLYLLTPKSLPKFERFKINFDIETKSIF